MFEAIHLTLLTSAVCHPLPRLTSLLIQHLHSGRHARKTQGRD